jgi:hypothetical protein
MDGKKYKFDANANKSCQNGGPEMCWETKKKHKPLRK